MRHLGGMWALAAVWGCRSAEADRLKSWEGMYAIDAYAVTGEGCEAEPTVEPPPSRFLQVDIQPGRDLSLLALRRCPSKDPCDSAPWFQVFVPAFREKSADGYVVDVNVLGLGAGSTCLLQWTDLGLSRDRRGALRVDVEVFQLTAAVSEAECAELLERWEPAPDECVRVHVIEGTR